jgi:AcrR family transcriptional regulator
METIPRQIGLRERKKQRTREEISDAALRLFAERGFEDVTTAEIAEAADVSQKTVFNYFPTKEDLVYSRGEEVEQQLREAIEGRERGQSVVDGMRRFLFDVFSRLGDKDAPEAIGSRARIIAASPALQARERAVFEGLTRRLAELIAEKEGDPLAYVAANALVGVNRALLESARRKVLANRRGKRLVDEVLVELDESLALLERGLGNYGKKR